MTRLSVAVWPPSGVVEVVSRLERPTLPGVIWSAPRQWLVKVRPLGHVDAQLIPQLADVLEAEFDGAPTVDCVLGPATRRLGGQCLGAPVHGLEEMAAVVFEVTEDLVPITHPQPFSADLILARGKVPKELAGIPIHATWTAKALTLVADRSSPRGARLEDMVVIELGR